VQLSSEGRGHHPRGLTCEQIIEAAIRLIDASGLQALTVRRLAGDLGVEAPALYHHFSDKAAILAAVADWLWQSIEPPLATDDWRASMLAWLRALREAFLLHPHAISLLATATATSPAARRSMSAMERIVLRAGLDAQSARAVLHGTGALLVGYGFGILWSEQAPADDGQTVHSAPGSRSPADASDERLARWDDPDEFDAVVWALLTSFGAPPVGPAHAIPAQR
jgi:AcrR family transcriptional regulator